MPDRLPFGRLLALAVVVGLLTGATAYLVQGIVASRSPVRTGSGDPGAATSPSGSGSTSAAGSPAQRAYRQMTPAQRVGQLFVVGVAATGATAQQRRLLRASAAGNVLLDGDSTLGVSATRRVSDRLVATTRYAGVRPFVAVAQEGGQAQPLSGPGFSTIPSATEQGRLDAARLGRDAATWGRELRRAGITLNLAPVADVVPSDVGRSNRPVGREDRSFGSIPFAVGRSAAAVVRGMRTARVPSAVTTFPGLGRATGDPQSDARATDPTTRDDLLLTSFRGAVAAGPAMVMVSSARYPDIDPDRPACFSTTVIGDLLRGDLGYHGIVISDRFTAATLAGSSPAANAVRFLTAGGTVVLAPDARDLAPMTKAVLDRAADDPAFARIVQRAVVRVLGVKARFGLLG